jgi:hypothetical protein
MTMVSEARCEVRVARYVHTTIYDRTVCVWVKLELALVLISSYVTLFRVSVSICGKQAGRRAFPKVRLMRHKRLRFIQQHQGSCQAWGSPAHYT